MPGSRNLSRRTVRRRVTVHGMEDSHEDELRAY